MIGLCFVITLPRTVMGSNLVQCSFFSRSLFPLKIIPFLLIIFFRLEHATVFQMSPKIVCAILASFQLLQSSR